MAAEGAFQVAGIELPDLDGAVLSAGGQLGVQGVERECSYVALVSAHLLPRRGLGNVQIFAFGVGWAGLLRALRQFLLQVLDLFFKVVDLFLEGEDGLPLELEFVAFGVDIAQRCPDLLRHHLCCSAVVILH